MADYNFATALPGANRYPNAHNGGEFTTALPRTNNFSTALPKPKHASSSKSKDKSPKKKDVSSYPSGGEYSTALPRVRDSPDRVGVNGYSPSGMATALPQVKGSCQQAGQGPQSQTAFAHPFTEDGDQDRTDLPSGSHYSTALPRVKQNAAAASGWQAEGSFATALPRPKEHGHNISLKTTQNGEPAAFLPKAVGHPVEAVRSTGSPLSGSPRLVRRADSNNTHVQHIAKTIYNTFWGQGLTFHPFTHGDTPVSFPALWPDRRTTLMEAFKGAELDKNPYELCKLLLATNSHTTLDVLLEEKVLPLDRSLVGGCGEGNGCGHTLAHMACALGLSEVVQSIIKRGGAKQQHIWNAKDEDDHTPEEVCFKPELRRIIPEKPMFGRRRVSQGQLLKPAQKRLMFELASSPSDFYRLVLMLQMYVFDVNNERNEEGDLLVHVAIRGGLLQLPLLFVLVNIFKADLYLKDRSGATPLTLAIEMGDEALVEVCVCVFGVAVNRSYMSNCSTPLHQAITTSQPRIVSILLRRGADPCSEDSEGRDPLFLAKKLKAYESRQIITQFLKERIERLYQDAITGRLDVSKLYQSDLHAVCSNGCTLLMVAAMYGQDNIVRQLLKKDVPIDFKQIKTGDLLKSLSDSFEATWCETHSTRDHTLKTAVHLAAEKGNLKSLQLLLDANAHPSMMDSTGMIPLHYAVDGGHIECVKLILNYPNTALGLTGLKPALDIARENQFPEILDLLEKARKRRQKELVKPLLFEIARSGNDEHILHVFENGDDTNPLDDMLDWPLLVAARRGHNNIVVQLHQFGGHIAQRHRRSRTTPLHEAAREGHIEVIKYLLKFCHKFYVAPIDDGEEFPLPSGALDDNQLVDINGRNTVQCTPLELAAGQGHTDVVRLLLEHKASTSLPDSTGRLVSCIAFAGTQFRIESHRKAHLQTILTVITKGVSLEQFQQCWHGPSDFNLIKENGDSILLVAAAYACLDVLRFLLEEAAAMRPASLVSAQSDTELHRISEVSDESPMAGHSRCLSDSQAISAYAHQNNMTRSLRFNPDEAEEEDQPAGRKTALPTVFTTPGRSLDRRRNRRREDRHMASGVEAPPPKPPRGNRNHGAQAASGSEEEAGPHDHDNYADDGAPQYESDMEGEEQIDIFTELVRYTNPRDGQSTLHRAALNCRHDNIKLLLERDKGLANLQDKVGNTPLHVACTKAGTRPGRLTVQTLLECQHVLTLLRNKQGDLPEQLCIKAATRKLIVRTRQSRNEQEPSSQTAYDVNVLVPADPMGNGFPDHANGLDGIPEGMTSEPYMSDLTTRLQQMKMDRQEKLANQRAEEDQDGKASPPT